jgi:hypothetical protein
MRPVSLLGATATGFPSGMPCLLVKEFLDLGDLHDYVYWYDGQHELGAEYLTQGVIFSLLTSLDSLDTKGDQMST